MGRADLNFSQAETALLLQFWDSQDNVLTTGPLCKRWVFGSTSPGRCENTAVPSQAQKFDLETYAQKKTSCLGCTFLWIPQNQGIEGFSCQPLPSAGSDVLPLSGYPPKALNFPQVFRSQAGLAVAAQEM